MKSKTTELEAKKISRKDALKKAGMYAAFTAAASIVLLTPKKAMAASAPPGPGWGKADTPKGANESNNVSRKA